jgi:hypothetical protein
MGYFEKLICRRPYLMGQLGVTVGKYRSGKCGLVMSE